MELGPMELTLIAVAVISLVFAAFGLAWIEASPRKRHTGETLD
jgi:hypothetical protein